MTQLQTHIDTHKIIAVTDYFVIVHFYTFINRVHILFPRFIYFLHSFPSTFFFVILSQAHFTFVRLFCLSEILLPLSLPTAKLWHLVF